MFPATAKMPGLSAVMENACLPYRDRHIGTATAELTFAWLVVKLESIRRPGATGLLWERMGEP